MLWFFSFLCFIDDVSVGDTDRPGSHVGSRCHDVIMKFFGTCTSLRKKKKLETNIPPKQLQVGFDALMYMCLIYKTKQIFILRSVLWYRRVYGFCGGFRRVCTKTRAMDRTVCNLFLFPKKPYCYCNIMKNITVVLWRLILHYIVDFLFCFRFSFLTEMLYHIFLKISRKREMLICSYYVKRHSIFSL